MDIEPLRQYARLMQSERISWMKVGEIELQLAPDAFESGLIATAVERIPNAVERPSDAKPAECLCGKPLGNLLPGLCNKCALIEAGVRG